MSQTQMDKFIDQPEDLLPEEEPAFYPETEGPVLYSQAEEPAPEAEEPMTSPEPEAAPQPSPRPRRRRRKKRGFPLWAAILLGLALSLGLALGVGYVASSSRQEVPVRWQVGSTMLSDGRLRRTRRLDLEGRAASERVERFDSQGNRTELRIYLDRELTGYRRWSYDSEGNITQSLSLSKDGSLSRRTEYEYSEGALVSKSSYDAYGRLVSYIRYTPNGQALYWEITEYTAAGDVSWFGRYSANRSLDYWREYQYDDQGHLIQRLRYSVGGVLAERSEYQYDEQGRLLCQLQYDANGVLNTQTDFSYGKDGGFSTWTYFYGYDGGQSREYTEYNSRGDRTYYAAYPNNYYIGHGSQSSYDDQGRLVEHSEFSTGGWVYRTYTYEYDDQGRELRRYTTGYYELPSYYENVYDAEGNCIERIYYDNNGNVTNRVEDPEEELSFRKSYRPDW